MRVLLSFHLHLQQRQTSRRIRERDVSTTIKEEREDTKRGMGEDERGVKSDTFVSQISS